MAVRILSLAALCAALLCGAPARAQTPAVSEGAGGVTVNLVDTELRAAVQALSQFLDRPVFFGTLGNTRVTFQSPGPVARADIPRLLRGLLEDQGYEMAEVDGAYRIRQRAQAAPAQPQGAIPASGRAPGEVELNVIRLRHARAADVAATVNALYGRGGALGERAGRGAPLSEQLRDNRIAPAGEAPGAGPRPVPNGELAGDAVIVPDARTNSLLVRASAADFELIRAAVAQVDVRPLQVVIEATVAFIRRDYQFRFGISGATGDVPVPGTGNSTGGGSIARSDEGDLLTLRAFNLGGIDLNLVLEAGESNENVTIVDRPVVLAANNQPAKIVVGEQRPFVQLERTTDAGVLDQVVQYKDVGTTLEVLPTISADGYVQLEVLQEVNSASGDESLNAPIISTRSITTALLMRDGQTVVLGGLSGIQMDRGSGGVPFLSSLPLVGGLFGRKSRRNTDSELFVFLTARVIYTDEDLTETTDDVRSNTRHVPKATRRRRPLLTPAKPKAPATAPAEAPQQP